MKALTIKELAPYLPYGLEINYRVLDLENGNPNTDNPDDRMKDCRMVMTGARLDECMRDPSDRWFREDSKFKPLLRPLSSLTKEITANGEKFVPIERIAIESCPFQIKEDAIYETAQEDQMCYCNIIVRGFVIWCVAYHYHTGNFYTGVEEDKVRFYQIVCHQLLFEYHFDVFNLIENNLAEPIKE